MQSNRSRLVCMHGHSFDIARGGYVNLTGGHRKPTGDSAKMIAARAQFLGGGHYRPLADAIRSLARRHDPAGSGAVIDLAGGTAYYLAATLDALPHRFGLCVDLSRAALRHAVRAHPRVACVASDVWQPLPIASQSAATVLSIFGPRDTAEIERILAPSGTVIVASPNPAHLEEIIAPLGLIRVDPRKSERLATAFARFELVAAHDLAFELSLGHDEVSSLVTMGPSAHHYQPTEIAERIRRLPHPVTVGVALHVAVYGRTLRPQAR